MREKNDIIFLFKTFTFNVASNKKTGVNIECIHILIMNKNPIGIGDVYSLN